jgi:hypothetical protein
MKFLDNIKAKLGKRKIEKILETKHRKVKVNSFATAKSIGILYQITTTDYQDFIHKYVDFLREEIGFKKIIALGYFDGPILPNFIINQSMKYKYITNKEIDFYHFGKNRDAINFSAEDFDILIDLSRDYINPIKQLVASSKSRFKIGRLSEENKPYFDFMVEIDKTAPVSKFIEQVNIFLTQVNPK